MYQLGLLARLMQNISPNLTFSASLQTSIVAGIRNGAPTYTRATTAYVSDWEGVQRQALSGETRFQGARRVQNLVNTKSEDWTNAAWTKTVGTVTATTLTSTGANQTVLMASGAAGTFNSVLRVRMSRIAGVGNVDLTLDGGSTWTTMALTASPQVFSISQSAVSTPKPGIRIVTLGDAINADQIQLENTTGQSNTNPSEYVSVGVLAAPFQGANVDGVQYFSYQNGNTVASNVVTQALGAAISSATLLGYLAEGARTNLCLQSRDLSNASWTKTTATGAKDQVGIDGITNSASSLTATAINGSCLQTITEAATLSALSLYIKRITGTGTVTIQQGASTLNVAGSINSSTYTKVELDATVLNPAIGIVLGTSGDKIAVDMVQFENGGFASSPIPTTTVSVARNADVLSYPFTSNANAATGTAYFEGSTEFSTANPTAIPLGFDANGGPLSIASAVLSTTISSFDGTTAVSKSALTDLHTAVRKRICSWGATGQSVTGDGSAPATGAFDGAMGSTAVAIGVGTGGANSWFGTVRNVLIWNQQLADAVLQQLTT